MIKKYTYKGVKKGNSLLILGAIHGNEICGPIAIHKIIKEIENHKRKIQEGIITFVPVANPRAYREKKRYIDSNLNRLFGFTGNPTNYEETLVYPLQKLIEKHTYTLDIHSLSGGKNAFLFQGDRSIETDKFAIATNIGELITGRDNLFDHTGWTTDDYANHKGNHAICIECGQHSAPEAPEIAYQAIINTMKHLNIIKGNISYKTQRKVFKMNIVYTKKREGQLKHKLHHGEKVYKGDILASYNNATHIYAPSDGYILLPKHRSTVGDEWFYFAQKEIHNIANNILSPL